MGVGVLETLPALMALLPRDLADDENLRLMVISLSTKTSRSLLGAWSLREEYRLLRDLTEIHGNYLSRSEMNSFRPLSKEIAERWEVSVSWDDDTWRRVKSIFIDSYRRQYWALSIAFAATLSRRSESIRWAIATALTAGTVGAGIVLAANKLGIL